MRTNYTTSARNRFLLIKDELIKTANDFDKRRQSIISTIAQELIYMSSFLLINSNIKYPNIVITAPTSPRLISSKQDTSFPEIDNLNEELKKLTDLKATVVIFKPSLKTPNWALYNDVFSKWNLFFNNQKELIDVLDNLLNISEKHFNIMQKNTLKILHPNSQEYYCQKSSLLNTAYEFMQNIKHNIEEIRTHHLEDTASTTSTSPPDSPRPFSNLSSLQILLFSNSPSRQ